MSLLMPEVEYEGPDGTKQRVKIPGQRSSSGAVDYDENTHKGHLVCADPDCHATVHYCSGSQDICGSSLKGTSPHFKTNPGQEHAPNCLIGMQIHEADHNGHYDMNAGYRIHLNTGPLFLDFGKAAEKIGTLYSRKDDHKININDVGLRSMQPISVRNINDLMTLMQKGDSYRLQNAKVVWRHRAVDWKNFLIDMTKPQSEGNVIDTLASKFDEASTEMGGYDFPRLAKVYVPRGRFTHEFKGHPYIKAGRRSIKHGNGSGKNLLSRITITDDKPLPEFYGGHTFFVLCQPNIVRRMQGGLVTSFVNFAAPSTQIAEVPEIREHVEPNGQALMELDLTAA